MLGGALPQHAALQAVIATAGVVLDANSSGNTSQQPAQTMNDTSEAAELILQTFGTDPVEYSTLEPDLRDQP